jgi:flagellar basal body rod protein FlgB
MCRRRSRPAATDDDASALYRVPYHPSRDGNTVEIGVEQAAFSQNATDFQTSLTFVNMKLKGLAKAIRPVRTSMSFKIFQIAGSAMAAQTVRLNTIASNLANADSVAGTEGDTYRARKPVFAAVMATARRQRRRRPVQVLDVVQSTSRCARSTSRATRWPTPRAWCSTPTSTRWPR